MIGCYIIFSEKIQKFYVGVTQEDVSIRIKKHNNHSYGTHRFTAKANDWELFLFITTEDYQQAVRIERKIKSMKSAEYIKNLKKYSELLEKLVSSTLLSRKLSGQGGAGSPDSYRDSWVHQ